MSYDYRQICQGVFVDYGFPVYVFAYKSMNRLSS